MPLSRVTNWPQIDSLNQSIRSYLSYIWKYTYEHFVYRLWPPCKLGGISFIVQTCITQFPARSDLMNHLRMSILSIYCILIRAVLLLLVDSYAFKHISGYITLYICFRTSDHPKEFTDHQSCQNGQQYHLPDSLYYCHTHSLDWHQYLQTHP